MESVIECVRKGKHGLIESPTGTGKTLSIICAAVAAVQKSRQEYIINEANKKSVTSKKNEDTGETTAGEDEEKKSPDKAEVAQTIIFCTRTHSQIEQIFRELKSKLPYSLRISPFASRKHACIFEDLSQRFPGNALNLSCQLLRKLNAIQRKMDPNAQMSLETGTREVKDIEDTA